VVPRPFADHHQDPRHRGFDQRCRSAVGGQAIEPGDAVLCDESGVVVLKPATAEAYASARDRDAGARARAAGTSAQGEWLPDISGATAHVEGKLAKT